MRCGFETKKNKGTIHLTHSYSCTHAHTKLLQKNQRNKPSIFASVLLLLLFLLCKRAEANEKMGYVFGLVFVVRVARVLGLHTCMRMSGRMNNEYKLFGVDVCGCHPALLMYF